jgi:hypothetical protein
MPRVRGCDGPVVEALDDSAVMSGRVQRKEHTAMSIPLEPAAVHLAACLSAEVAISSDQIAAATTLVGADGIEPPTAGV